MRVKRTLVLGLAVSCLGLALIVRYEPAAVDPFVDAIEGTGFDDRTLLYVVAGLALLFALWGGLRRGRVEPVRLEATPEVVESTHPVLGGDVDRRLERLADRSRSDERVEERRAIQRDLERLAIETVATREGVSRAEATRLVESGEWTDDPAVATFLARVDRSLPLRVRVVDWFHHEATFTRRVRRTIECLANDGVDFGDGPGRSASGDSEGTNESETTESLGPAGHAGRVR